MNRDITDEDYFDELEGDVCDFLLEVGSAKTHEIVEELEYSGMDINYALHKSGSVKFADGRWVLSGDVDA